MSFDQLRITEDELYRIMLKRLERKRNNDTIRIHIFNKVLLQKLHKITNKINLKLALACNVCSSILPISIYTNRQLKTGALRKCPPCAQNAIYNEKCKNTIYV